MLENAYTTVRSWLLSALKVPHEPHAPFGDPTSLRVFRAGRNYFYLRLVGWGIAQIAAFAGILFWMSVFREIERTVEAEKDAAAHPAPKSQVQAPTPNSAPTEQPAQKRRHNKGLNDAKAGLAQAATRLPDWSFPVLWLIEGMGFVAYLAQIPFTFFVRRLDYEMRWYIVTDRSLRIRTGVWSVQELTMSFANLQQVVVTQGPVQRLLGLADVRVQSAGGGSGGHEEHGSEAHSLHTGYFHGVDNAEEIRDLILARLKHFRESGLGDPEEARHAAGITQISTSTPPQSDNMHDVLAAARELTAEARALRASVR